MLHNPLFSVLKLWQNKLMQCLSLNKILMIGMLMNVMHLQVYKNKSTMQQHTTYNLFTFTGKGLGLDCKIFLCN